MKVVAEITSLKSTDFSEKSIPSLESADLDQKSLVPFVLFTQPNPVARD